MLSVWMAAVIFWTFLVDGILGPVMLAADGPRRDWVISACLKKPIPADAR
jgi:hypothetical protein